MTNENQRVIINPIATRLHEAATLLEGSNFPEIVEAFNVGARELDRLQEQLIEPNSLRTWKQIAEELAARCDAEARKAASLEANIVGVLEQLGQSAIRAREGGGPEDLAMSLAISVVKLQREHSEHSANAVSLFDECVRLREENARVLGLINSPQIADFIEACKLEAIHQRERWGTDHDAGKTDVDWLFLVGFLGGKAVEAGKTIEWLIGGGDIDNPNPAKKFEERRLHHIIAAGAAVLNWHAARSGGDNRMRPGIEPPAQEAIDSGLMKDAYPPSDSSLREGSTVRVPGVGEL